MAPDLVLKQNISEMAPDLVKEYSFCSNLPSCKYLILTNNCLINTVMPLGFFYIFYSPNFLYFLTLDFFYFSADLKGEALIAEQMMDFE